MIKRLTPLLFALGTLPVLAQQTPKPDPTQAYSLLDGKTIIKTNPFSDIFGNLNLKVERIITDGLSAQFSVFSSPGNSNGEQIGAFHSVAPVISNTALYPYQPKYIAFSPQIRWYLNDGLGYGFYIHAYYHFQRNEFNDQVMRSTAMYGSALDDARLNYNGHSTMHAVGFGIGAQWLFGRRKNIVLDWYIAGIGRGFVRGDLYGSFIPPANRNNFEEAFRGSLPNDGRDAEISYNKEGHTVRITNIKYQAYVLDMGLSIGFRF